MPPFNEWPDEPEIIKIGFKEGVPCAIDDEPMTPVQSQFKNAMQLEPNMVVVGSKLWKIGLLG